MRFRFLVFLNLMFFQSFCQLQQVNWISPSPHGCQFVEVVNGPSSNYYALGNGGFFYELGDSLRIIQRSEIDRSVRYFHAINGRIIHVLSDDVLYMKYKINSNLSTPETHILSTDGGKTWNASPHQFQYLKSYGDTSYGVTHTGFYSSFDGGQNWSLNWSNDSLGMFEMVGDTIIYTRAFRELRIHYAGIDSLLLDFQSPFGSNTGNNYLTFVWGMDYLSTDLGVLTVSNGKMLVIDHVKERIDTVSYPISGATLHHAGNLNYYAFFRDEIIIYTDTLKSIVTQQLGSHLKYNSIVPSDSGALVRYVYWHNGDFAYRYGFIDFSNLGLKDVMQYRYSGNIGSPYQKQNGDILTFTNDNIYVWESSKEQISHFKASTSALKIGRYVDDAFGMLLTSGNGAAAFSMDEGHTWTDIRGNQSPPGLIKIQSPSEFISINDYSSSLPYLAPHNIQLIYSLDQGQTWNRSQVLSSGSGISDAWVFGTDSMLGIVQNHIVMFNLPDLSFQPEFRNGPNTQVHVTKLLSDGSLIAVTGNGLYTSNDNGRNWDLRASQNIEAGYDDLQFSGNGMMYIWNQDSSKLYYSQDTGLTLSSVKFFPYQLNLVPGQKGDLIFTEGNRLAVYRVDNDISVEDWYKPQGDFVLYPNPAGANVHIEIPKHFIGGYLEIINLKGHGQISLPTETYNIDLDLSTLPSGQYLVKVMKASRSVSKKLLILK